MAPLLLILPILLSVDAAAAQDRPGVFFREDWAETPPATPVTQAHVTNPALSVSRYGPGKDGIKKSHHDRPADDPYYVWSGPAPGNWALTLRHRGAYADLQGLAKVRWRTRQSGFRRLHLIVKLADGRWLVSDPVDAASSDWREREINLSDLGWRRLNIQTVTEGARVEKPDLSRVDEIGITDLMHGGHSGASSRLDWIEVWGEPVPRAK